MRRLPGIVVTLLVVTACAGGDQADPSELVLRASDLAEDWNATPHDVGNDDLARIGMAFGRCVGAESPLVEPTARADSPDFSRASGAQQAKSTVERVGEEAAVAGVERFLADRSPECLTEVFVELLDEADLGDIVVRSISTEPLTVAPAADVDRVAALQTLLDLRIGEVDTTVVIDNVLLADGPWFARLNFVGLDEDLRTRLVDVVAERIDDASR